MHRPTTPPPGAPPYTRELGLLRRRCHILREKVWDMNDRRERFEARRWVEGHIGESFLTASADELRRLEGYLAYKLKHGHCPLHEHDNSDIRYKKAGGSTDARNRIKEKLIEMFGERCVDCGKSGIPLTLDHIKPIALGGKNELGNSQLLCVPCHVKKTKTDSRIAFKRHFAKTFPEKIAKRRALAAERRTQKPRSQG
jgi:5-methylcytosine-specific restriction endonuclease McrA